jgi:glycosyltransferase 2 family protein
VSARQLLASPWLRLAVAAVTIAATVTIVWWRGPDWESVWDAFSFVHWWWIVLAIALNLLSTAARAFSWRLTLGQALPTPQPPFVHVFSAFGIGLLGNAALPARAGEVARVAILRRHVDRGSGTSATLLGTVFAHRLFDLPAVALLVLYVVLTAKIPHWAVTGLGVFFLVGIALAALAMLSARRGQGHVVHAGSAARRVVEMARQGLAVLRTPIVAAAAVVFQLIGWFLQLLAVWTVMEAFEMHISLPAAGLVLLLMNIATIFPLWPGNFGLLQAAVALPLVQYGVDYPTGFAYGIVLQAVEMSVGVGVGLAFLAREGLSFATLRGMDGRDAGSEVTSASQPGGDHGIGRSEAGAVPADRADEVVALESN